MSEAPWKRVLLKLSGEALGDESTGAPFDPAVIDGIATQLAAALRRGLQVGVVVGGGNLFRGGTADWLSRPAADGIGMLATAMNAIALADGFIARGLDARVLSAVPIEKFCETFTQFRAERHLAKGRVVVFAAGTGNPFFTTDTAAALRAAEIGADALLKATRVDGVYDSDPEKNPGAKRFERLSYDEVLSRGLRVMDLTAISFCREHGLPVFVFDMTKPGNITRALAGEPIGTLVGR